MTEIHQDDSTNIYNHMMIVCHSCGLEGSELDIENTTSLLIDGVIHSGKYPVKVVDLDMVRDHFSALNYVLECAKEKKLITLDFIQEINRRVMKNTGSIGKDILRGAYDTSSGEIRKIEVRAGLRRFPKSTDLMPLLTIFFDTLSEFHTLKFDKINEVYDYGYRAHFNLVSIHPFGDGNGRTSRLLMNYIEAVYNLPLTIILKEDKPIYVQALENARANQDEKIIIQCLNHCRSNGQKVLDNFIEKHSIKWKRNPSNFGLKFMLQFIFFVKIVYLNSLLFR